MYLQRSLSAVDILADLLNNDQNNQLFNIPSTTYTGRPSAAEVENISNSTGNRILWSLFGQVPNFLNTGLAPNVQISDVKGYTIDFAFSPVRQANKQGNGEAFALIPNSANPVPYTNTYNGITIYSSCPTTQYLYYVDPNSGAITNTTAFEASSTNICTKNWYYPAFQTTETIWSYPYFGTTTNSLIYGLGKQYATSGGERGVIEVSLVLSFLSTYIQEMNTFGNQQVAYIMTYTNPAYLLVATTTNITLSTNTYATTSSNQIISATANFIKNNAIKADTTEYISSVGCQMTAKFYTSPGGSSGLIYAPVSFGSIPPASKQAQWIVVSCAIQPNPETVYTSSNDDDNVPSTSTLQPILGVSATVLALLFVLLLLFILFVAGVFQQKPSLASQATRDVELNTKA